MSITHRILGQPGWDNAMLVSVDTGEAVSTMLFDCGQNCLDALPLRTLQAVDHLFFSHLHMDHIAGFDTFVRCNYDRSDKENHIWGPSETADIIQHRLQGYKWNLNKDMRATWYVHDYDGETVKTFRFELHESFAEKHFEGEEAVTDDVLLGTEDFGVKAFVMDHYTPCLAYLLEESSSVNIDTGKMKELGLTPGPWLQAVKNADASAQNHTSEAPEGYSMEELREKLLVTTPGASLAYLTDFFLGEDEIADLSRRLYATDTIVCEAQYKHADQELAGKNYHMTTKLTGELAARAEAEKLVLFHLSQRYEQEEWIEMLNEARTEFPNTQFPDTWEIS